MEIKITFKNGETLELNPVKTLTIDNGHRDYQYDPAEITSIEIYPMAENL